MSKRIVIALGVVVVLAAAATVIVQKNVLRSDDGPLTLYGNVDIREVRLGFRVPGRLALMHYEEGDRIEAGALLAELDSVPYAEALRAADARVAIAEAQLRLVRSGSRPEEIERAEANVHEARAARRNADQELERQRGLDERGLTSKSVLDQAAARAEEAAARLRAAEEALALARAGFRPEEIAAAEAALELARAEAAKAATEYADTRLDAPAEGTLTTRIREPGSILAAGEPVYVLSLDRPVFIRAYVDEPNLGQVAPGRAASVHTDGSSRPYRAQVGFVSPRAEFTPKTVETETARTQLVYRVRIVVTDPDSGLRQGMPVTVTFDDTAGE